VVATAPRRSSECAGAREFEVAGLATNADSSGARAGSRFRPRRFDTGLIERIARLLAPSLRGRGRADAAALSQLDAGLRGEAPRSAILFAWSLADGWRANQDAVQFFVFQEAKTGTAVTATPPRKVSNSNRRSRRQFKSYRARTAG